MNHSLNSLRISGFPVDSGLRQFIFFCFIDVIFQVQIGCEKPRFFPCWCSADEYWVK